MKRSLLWPTVFAVVGIAVLLGLGVWQVQRLYWKQGLIARIEARAYSEPVSLDAAVRGWSESSDIDYLRVRLTGRFLHGKELHLYDVIKGQAGWRIITPLVTGDGAAVLVDRGFAPDALKDSDKRVAGQLEGTVTVTGLARAPGGQGLFTPDNEPARNLWYWRDLEAMASTALDASEQEQLVPFFIAAERAPVPGGWPKGGVTRLNLPNRHLEYALTWFGLAAGLAGVYGVFAWARLKADRSA